jgi:hypothetical protein
MTVQAIPVVHRCVHHPRSRGLRGTPDPHG